MSFELQQGRKMDSRLRGNDRGEGEGSGVRDRGSGIQTDNAGGSIGSSHTERAAIQKPEMYTPIILPRFDRAAMSRIFVTGFVQKPRSVSMASGRSSKSATVGLFIQAWTRAATQPEAINGCRVVIGAARKAERIVRG